MISSGDGLRGAEIKRRFHGGQRGSALLETALALLLAFPASLWAFEICMFTYSQSVVCDAARMGVRYAIVHGADSSQCSGPGSGAGGGCGDPSGANVVSTVQAYAANSMHDMSGMTVNVSYPDSLSTPPSRVIVTVADPYVPYLDLPGLPQTMNATAEGRIVY